MNAQPSIVAAPASIAAGSDRAAQHVGRNALLVAAGVIVALATIGLASRWWSVGRFIEHTDDAYVGGNITEISPHVAGFIARIAVTDNQFVHAGELLIQLAPDDFQAARSHTAALLEQRRETVTNLTAQLALQRSLILQAQAELDAQRSALRFAAQDAQRYQDLATAHAGTVRDAQRSVTAWQSAAAAVSAAQAHLQAVRQQLMVLQASIGEARAASREAGAQLRSAELNLGYTQIRAPIDGYIGDRAAQVGAYVTAGTQLLSIVPAEGLWVDANFKEDQIGAMRPGQPAAVVADVLPGKSFQGHIVSLAPATGAVFSVIPPQNATGNFTKIVQRVPVRIALDGRDGALGLLRAGLSVTASIDTREYHTDGSP
ncbi:MAG TPA: HlyD family secretion protein [Steroidobacteraceae bacterium]|jgi:membrane fusion protein (multidrug efflux system)|nr:HlyD family secretion protein [Steroidobacteraceae bacterium]